jgi:hypothetical protein
MTWRADPPDIVAVDMKRRVALMNDDTECPITNMLTLANEETDDPDLCRKVIVKVRDDCWLGAVVEPLSSLN